MVKSQTFELLEHLDSNKQSWWSEVFDKLTEEFLRTAAFLVFALVLGAIAYGFVNISTLPIPEALLLFAAILIIAFVSVVFLRRWFHRTHAKGIPSQATVKVGKKDYPLNTACKFKDSPSPEDLLEYSKQSVIFSGGNLHLITTQYRSIIKKWIGVRRLRFLLLEAKSPIGEAISQIEKERKMEGSIQDSYDRLTELQQGESDWFKIKRHRLQPFNMNIVDIEDRERCLIQIGYYAPDIPSPDRLAVLVMADSPLFDPLLSAFLEVWPELSPRRS
jgi:hypothetical protein